MTSPRDYPQDRVIEFSMPSRLELLVVLDGLVQSICSEMDFEQADVDAIANSVIEAASNAVQHAHEQEADLPVQFRFVLADEELVVEVHDAGKGFDIDQAMALDPTGPEGILKSRGRGIFIMRAMMDSVDFDIEMGKGTLVRMKKSRRSKAGAEA